jgi:periplasmic protein TonB
MLAAVRSTTKRFATRLLFALLLALVAAPASAQDRVYPPEELSDLPKIARSADAVAVINEEYPKELKAARIGGRVQVRMILNADGTVDASSVQIIAATNEMLGEAAARAVKRMQFAPGKANGKAVRTVVLLPFKFG